MAIVRPSLSRLAASCVRLDSARRLPVLKTRAVDADHGTFVEGPRLFKNSRPSCSSYPLWNDVHLEHTAGCRSCGSVRSCGCPLLRGLLTAAGSDTGNAGSATHVLRVPSLGDSITEGTVVEWRRGVGSVVRAEEVVCVLETDKVSVDIAADITGRIVSLAVEVGGTALVGGDLATIEPLSPEAAASDVDSSTTAPDRPTAPVTAQEISGCHKGEPRFNVADKAEDPVDSHSWHGPRKPRILFRSVRSRLERQGIFPPQQQGESPTESTGQRKDKQEVKRVAETGPSATIITYNGLEELPAFLVRPALSAEEIEAINDGGVANLDAAARAWTVSLSFQPVSAAMKRTKSSQASRPSL